MQKVRERERERERERAMSHVDVRKVQAEGQPVQRP
jgi:hypothetical protein